MSFQEEVKDLFRDQLKHWPLLADNWARLDAARVRTFAFDGFRIQVQFNPRRMGSSAAKIDKQSIEKRPCFLCRENQPPEEACLPFGRSYQVFCNPFPIFREHFTIGSLEHRPQVIDSEFMHLLELSRQMPELVVFYNAPNCGASAPDHMHFQAGARHFMPIEEELPVLKSRFGRTVVAASSGQVQAIDDGLRRFLLLESVEAPWIEQQFGIISTYMRGLRKGEEAMLNILCYHRQHWQVLVFPRELHRPRQFFAEGEENILLSPASVDMGGTLITPLEKDFRKIGRDDITDIFRQIGLSQDHFEALIHQLGPSS